MSPGLGHCFAGWYQEREVMKRERDLSSRWRSWWRLFCTPPCCYAALTRCVGAVSEGPVEGCNHSQQVTVLSHPNRSDSRNIFRLRENCPSWKGNADHNTFSFHGWWTQRGERLGVSVRWCTLASSSTPRSGHCSAQRALTSQTFSRMCVR